ncbi:DUF86 domain-containing protein [Egicoccus sp. AB-alg2]|uniref:type VII toxin-antitoxin system HepT family RNase toxin n=1 Tax=Egicoccus sp. AB-alg2 TaxID=3242693 RepID=UPI00359ED603
MVDVERLARLLRRVTDDVGRLRDASGAPGLVADEVVLDHVKYRFVTAIEAAIDVAQHVCAAEGFQTPATNTDAMRRLLQHDVLERATGEGMARAVGFRNVLVDRYADVDDALVVEQLTELDVLEAFVGQVTARYL